MSVKQQAKTTGGPEVTPSTSTGQGDQGTSNSDVLDQEKREIYLRRAQTVVDESNSLAATGQDKVWLEQNGGNEGVFPDNGVKPDEWKRGISTKDDGFGFVHGAEATDIKDIEQFRLQIAHDLNFNGVFDDYKSSKEFEDSLIAQYAKGDAERKEQVRFIARNLWSYATTGMDIEGNTDVAELQGLLFSLDPLIADASQSNTKHENTFTIPGTNIELNTGGDDYYGRATMLEARLLSSLLKDQPLQTEETPVLDLVPEVEPETPDWTGSTVEDDDEFAKSTFIMDVSSSMYNDHDALSDFFQVVDFGDTKMGSMTSKFNGTQWHKGGEEVSMDEGRKVMKGLAGVNMERGNSSKRDRAGKISNMFSNIGSGHEESPIHTAYQLLLSMQESGRDADAVKGEQIVIATDEGDSAPQELRLLRNLANDMRVLVKVLFFTTNFMMEIVINEIDNNVMDLFEAELNGEQPVLDEGYSKASHGVDDYNSDQDKDGNYTHQLTYYRKNDNKRTKDSYHMEMRWQILAEMMGVEKIRGMKDRESRRD